MISNDSPKAGDYIGGLIGYLSPNVKIENCIITSIIPSSYSGMIFGSSYFSTGSASFSNIYMSKNGIEDDSKLRAFYSINLPYEASMLAFFDDLNSENFTYVNSTSELEEYKGNLITKLNKYVESHTSNNLLKWKIDNETGTITFDK